MNPLPQYPMSTTDRPDGTRLTQVALLVAMSIPLGFMVVLFRLMEGSWGEVGRTVASVLAILTLYAAPVAAIAVVGVRRGRTVKRWWFLALLPICGALAGAGVGYVDPGPAGLKSPITQGIVYGLLHALYLRWSWRREARRTGRGAA